MGGGGNEDESRKNELKIVSSKAALERNSEWSWKEKAH